MNGFTLTAVIAATPAELYQSWMSSEAHTRMTGSSAQVDGHIGGEFSAWDGYISGKTLALTPDREIVQAWRTSEFPDGTPDSRRELYFEEVTEGTRLTLTHSNLPADQVESYRQGWEDFYFKPMKAYFQSLK